MCVYNIYIGVALQKENQKSDKSFLYLLFAWYLSISTVWLTAMRMCETTACSSRPLPQVSSGVDGKEGEIPALAVPLCSALCIATGTRSSFNYLSADGAPPLLTTRGSFFATNPYRHTPQRMVNLYPQSYLRPPSSAPSAEPGMDITRGAPHSNRSFALDALMVPSIDDIAVVVCVKKGGKEEEGGGEVIGEKALEYGLRNRRKERARAAGNNIEWRDPTYRLTAAYQ
eukprot:gene8052-5605_t